jgi:uncharacterized membrane protein HdeD (DUF308 family)
VTLSTTAILLVYVGEYVISDPLMQLIVLSLSLALVLIAIGIAVIINLSRRRNPQAWDLPIDDPSHKTVSNLIRSR